MAGISAIKKQNGLLDKSTYLNEILNNLNYLSSYSSKVALMKDNIFLGWNKYSEYPVKVFESGDLQIIIEGKIYNKSYNTVEQELYKLINNLSELSLKNWLLTNDGEFVVFAFNNKTNTLIVFNDILGRIPLYFLKKENEIVISRFFRFINDFENNLAFDKTGMGEFLLFGYLLNDRTLYKNIQQMRPATLIVANDNEVSINIVNNFNFEERKYRDKDFKEIIRDLSELFSQACINRCNNGNNSNLIALTGGMDSRTIAACMATNKIPFQTTTMVFENKAEKEETKIAKQISDIFKVEWTPININPPIGNDLDTLLKLKEGMSYLATAFLLPFYRQIQDKFGGDINLITGDKGDKVILSFDNPIPKCSSNEELSAYILGEHSMINIAEVSSILKVHQDDILNDLLNLLNTYPENDFSQKYIHYRSIEKSHKLAYQGEDRHRKFIWTYGPLSSFPFVHYLFNCSDKSKKMHKLFIALLESFSPEAAGVFYTNFKSPITSLRSKLFMLGVYYVYPKINNNFRSKIKSIFFGGNPVISNQDSIIFRSIVEQLNNTDAIHDYFKINNASGLKDYRNIMVQSVFTLTSLIDNTYSNNSIVNKYSNAVFDHMN